ncbi:hypothetical protein FAIPA1_60092 [Frankia sp. AiPs1]
MRGDDARGCPQDRGGSFRRNDAHPAPAPLLRVVVANVFHRSNAGESRLRLRVMPSFTATWPPAVTCAGSGPHGAARPGAPTRRWRDRAQKWG